ncbi:hypothetical protein PUMCH_002223 [Australozyma saopauloensis]|uniref:Major facilitator superfamily (MFS) profile domain-containing protein n=1 Tax=Australozyma saopauloensis TaxID=291208 RepID=A0AAX4H9H8_9ASCO|nr:hypothetical protein PUMCH_002223 [[Candida] saopauloensis]
MAGHPQSFLVELQDLTRLILADNLHPNEGALPEVGVDVTIDELAMRPLNDAYQVVFEGHRIHVDSLDWRNSWLLRAQITIGWCIFILFGLGEQTLGTILPRLQKHYGINDLDTAFIFLAATSGYFVMAMVSEKCHSKYGYRGVGAIGTGCMITGYVIAGTGPYFPFFICAYFIVGVGFGCLDASFNGYIGNLVNSAPLLGILHGCYGIGCITTPPLVTSLIERKDKPWSIFHYYFVLAGLAATMMAIIGFVYRHESATKYRLNILLNEARREFRDGINSEPKDGSEASNTESLKNTSNDIDGRMGPVNSNDSFAVPEPKTSALKSKLVWSLAIIMFVYVSGEAAFGAWLVSYCIRIKHFAYQYSSYMASTFWAGLTIGRMVLGFVTEFYFNDELVANTTYIAGSLIGQTVFCIAVLFSFPAILFPIVFLLGFFVGPIFPTTIVATVNILPVHLHASGIGFICAFGGGGGAAAPFLIGLVASSSDQGLRFYPLICALLYVLLIVMWTALITYTKRGKKIRVSA